MGLPQAGGHTLLCRQVTVWVHVLDGRPPSVPDAPCAGQCAEDQQRSQALQPRSLQVSEAQQLPARQEPEETEASLK